MPVDSPDKVIDRSAKLVFSFFLSSAGLWLLTAALLAYVAAAKLTDPFFLSSYEFLTYGKIKVAQANAFVYGWGGNCDICRVSCGYWLVCPRQRYADPSSLFLQESFGTWRSHLGCLGIMDGHMSGHEMLEMPTEVWPAMLISYLIITFLSSESFIAPVKCVRRSHLNGLFLAALLWFPALFLIAWNGLEINPARGTLQTVLSMWYGQSLVWLWLTPVALGAAYYLNTCNSWSNH